MTEREKMLAGQIYDPGDSEIMAEQTACAGYLKEYNKLGLGDEARMAELLKTMLGGVGRNCFIQPPFFANWGGAHLFLGDAVYANANLTLVDDGNIRIGSCTMLGPNVTLATASHPIDPALRRKALQFNRDITIGENVWIGAGAIILPGVTIGDNSVIGAGSLVNRDIPANVVAVGNPCRVLREIGPADRVQQWETEE